MGCLSWKFANKKNRKALKIGDTGYLLCPDNTVLEACYYGGYGIFDGKNVFELVALWNLEDLDPEGTIPRKSPEREAEQWSPRWKAILKSLKEDGYEAATVVVDKMILNGEIPKCWHEEWLQYIGIEIADNDYQNAHLRYPIKVVSDPSLKYEDVPASMSDPRQGMRLGENNYGKEKTN